MCMYYFCRCLCFFCDDVCCLYSSNRSMLLFAFVSMLAGLKFSFIPFRSISILICSLDSSNFHVPSQLWSHYLKTSKREKKDLRSFDKQNRFFLWKKNKNWKQFNSGFFSGTLCSYSLHTHYIECCFVLLWREKRRRKKSPSAHLL